MAGLMTWLGDDWKKLQQGVGAAAGAVGNAVGTAAHNVESFLGTAGNNVAQGVGNAAHAVEQNVGNAAQGAGNAVGNAVQQTVVRPSENMLGNTLSAINNLPHAVNSGVQGFEHNVGNFANGVNNNVIKPVENFGTGLVNDAKPVLNTAAFIGTAPVAAITGNKGLQQLATSQLQHSLVPMNVATGKANPIEFAKDFTQTGLHYAPYAVPMGAGKLADVVGNAAEKVIAPVANKILPTAASNAAKVIANRAGNYAVNSAAGGTTNAGINVADQLINTGKVDPKQVLNSFGQGAAMSVAGPAASDALKLAKTSVPVVKEGAVRAANYGLKPPTNLTDAQLTSAVKVHSAQQGLTDPHTVSTQDLINYRAAEQKLGQKPGTPDGQNAVKNALIAHAKFDNQRLQRQVSTQDALQKSSQFAQDHLIPGGSLKPIEGQQSLFDNAVPKPGAAIPAPQLSPKEKILGSKPADYFFGDKQPVKDAVAKKANINDAADALGTTPEKLANSSSMPRSTDQMGYSSESVRENNPNQPQLEAQRPQSPQQLQSQTEVTAGKPGESVSSASDHPTTNPKTAESGAQQGDILPSSNGKYTTNSTSVKIDEVQLGDYQKVRSNAQRIESNVNVRARQAIHSVNRLPADEKANFWNVVEGTAKPNSPNMNVAVQKWRELADHVHATSKALGGDTPHLANYARHNWDLSDPEEAQRFTDLLNQRYSDNTGRTISPEDFKGIDNKPRAFDTIKEGQSQGFKLKNEGNPAQDIADYVKSANSKLKTQSVAKGMQEAEAHIPDSQKGVSQHIGYKSNITTTEQGAHELRALYESPQPRFTKFQKGVAKYDQLNRGTKATVLSLSQFHTANIGMQSIPTLAAKGHPIRALHAAVDTAKVTFSPRAADNMINAAIKDGTIDNAARIGTPILDGNDFNASGKLSLNAARGEKLIFERQLPAMHIQMVKALVDDLNKKGIPLDSPQARAAGNEVNQIMGYMNKTLNNMSARNIRGASRVMLAPNFTLSKWAVLKDAFTKGGQAGSYARAAVIGKYAAEAAMIAGVGAILGQKSDNWRDTLLRALVHPSIPTPLKDSKGNTIEFGLPANYLSEALGLGASLGRGTDGRLGVDVNPSNIPQNLANYGQGRLAALPSFGLKIGTNQNYAGKPLYDPNASTASKFAQGATTLATGVLPIGLQNLAYTDPVKNALGSIPGVGGDIKNVLDASTPGSNPLLKGIASALGATARTDKTVGQGLQTTQYFNALAQAGQGLNAHETDIFKQLTDSKKNPVTGQYDTTPSVYDTPAKANDLLQNPNVLAHLTAMNQALAKQGQTTDPFYSLTPAQQTQVLQINRLDPGNRDKTELQSRAGQQQWYKDYQTAQSGYYNNLPAGDPNRPQAPVQYVAPSQQSQDLANQYYNLTDPTEKANFIKNNPGVQDAFDATAKYDASIRAARGDPALKGYPTASPDLQQKLNTYDSLPTKSAKTAFGKANPDIYNYFQQVSQYSLENDASQAAYVGNNFTQKGAKAITSLANNIKYDGGLQDSNGNIIPRTGTGGTTGGSSLKSKGGRKSTGKTSLNKNLAAMKSINAAIKPPKMPKSITGKSAPTLKSLTAYKPTKFNPQNPTIKRGPRFSVHKA